MAFPHSKRVPFQVFSCVTSNCIICTFKLQSKTVLQAILLHFIFFDGLSALFSDFIFFLIFFLSDLSFDHICFFAALWKAKILRIHL